ncbi:MAG: hypothetical protein D4R82_00360 [Dehalococcoidia bacterium]|nr:MAG: hypothetical protein D4R82_00360 [Dehalococcoidia bacterium]
MKKPLWLLPVALMLALVLATTISASAQAGLVVSDLTISQDSVKEGETVYITTVVTADTDGTYTLILKINDELKETKEVELEAADPQTVSFTVTGGPPGDYIVDLNGFPGYFTVKTSFWAMFPPYLWAILGAIIGVLILFIIVLAVMPPRKKQAGTVPKATRAGRGGPPPATPTPTPMPTPFPTLTPGPMAAPHAAPTARATFSVSNLTITPNQVREGEPVTISAIVTNNGTESGKYSLVLRIGGVVEGITEITLASGTSQLATSTITKDTAGDYYIEIDGLGGTFTVIPLKPAHFTLSNLVIAPERVKQGESITISAVVTNTGEVTGSYSVVLKIKGTVEAIEEVNIGPGGSQRVAFDITKDTPGFYNIDLEGLTGRFVVEMEWNK